MKISHEVPLSLLERSKHFNDYDYATRSGYVIYSGGEIFENQIASNTFFNANGKRTTTFENVSGTAEMWFGGHWNKSYKKEAHLFKLNIGAGIGYTKSKGFTKIIKRKTSEKIVIRIIINLIVRS